MRRGSVAVAIIVFLAVAAGAGPRDVVRRADAGDQIVFVSLDSPDDASILSCVADSVRRARPDVTLLSAREFRDALFPWLEQATAPRNVEEFGRLLARAPVKQRLEELQLRYVAVVNGTTQMGPSKGGIACGGGMGAGGCFGLAWADRETRIATVLWDTKGTGPATLGAETKTIWIIPALILPIPVLLPTEGPACGAMAQQILGNLAGNPAAR
jgi:hypothetical protein